MGGGQLALAVVGTVLILAACGLGAGIADAISTDDAGRVLVLLGSAVALAPAVWVLVGVAVALFGVVPRAAPAAWGVLGACFLLLYLGPLLSLPEWVRDLSPYSHIPPLPAADLTVAPLLALTAIAAALIGVGLLGFRRRDMKEGPLRVARSSVITRGATAKEARSHVACWIGSEPQAAGLLPAR